MKTPLFLERQNYRRRRFNDMARLLPVLGLLLFLVPLLGGRGGNAQISTLLVYLFGVWALLIVFAAILARQLYPADTPDQGADPDGGGE